MVLLLSHTGAGGVRVGLGTLTLLRCLDEVSHLIGIWLLEDSLSFSLWLRFIFVSILRTLEKMYP